MNTNTNKPNTVNVRAWGKSTPACVGEDGRVRIYDDVAGYYTVCHRLTAGQIRYVRSRCAWGAVCR